MAKKRKANTVAKTGDIYDRIRVILESARANVARSVNTTQVVANWLIGREIVEEEQRGKKRADYGKGLLQELSGRLAKDFGRGWSVRTLEYCRMFYLAYPSLIGDEKSNALRSISAIPGGGVTDPNSNALRSKSTDARLHYPLMEVSYAASADSWQPGQLHPNLSWTHYRRLMRVDSPETRAFYEIEAIDNNWSARELERQINSLLYERLALSRDKQGLMRLAKQGQEISGPADVFKDPVVIETILKCFVLIDLKMGKLTHEDLGQHQLYVNYYDQQRCTPGDNPTLGLILCTDKTDAVVRYTLGPDQSKKIFASRYKLHLPSEAELRKEICRKACKAVVYGP